MIRLKATYQKYCQSCRINKPTTAFDKSTISKDGLKSKCIECNNNIPTISNEELLAENKKLKQSLAATKFGLDLAMKYDVKPITKKDMIQQLIDLSAKMNEKVYDTDNTKSDDDFTRYQFEVKVLDAFYKDIDKTLDLTDITLLLKKKQNVKV